MAADGRLNTPHSAVTRRTFIPTPSLSSFYLSPSLSFRFFFFFCLNPCSRGGVRCVSGQVMGNDTTEQSLNFSQRAGPLNLQVAVSFCRQCLNIVAVFNSHGPDTFSSPSAISFCKGDKWFYSWCMKYVEQSKCSHVWGLEEKNAVLSAVICSYTQKCAVVFLSLVSASPAT